MTVIAIANQKGGVGKTTTAINVGAYLAKQGKRVLIIDLDPQANTTSGLGVLPVQGSSSTLEVLFDANEAETALIETQYDGLQILPSKPLLATAEVELVNKQRREFLLKKALEKLDFDIVLIDCPPALGLLTLNALTASDYVLIPVQAEYYALEGLGQLLETINRVQEGLNSDLQLLGIVLTMHNRTTLSDNVRSELEKHFAGKIFKTIIPRNVRLAEAPSFGQPISSHDKWSKGAKAYKNLAKELVKRIEGGA